MSGGAAAPPHAGGLYSKQNPGDTSQRPFTQDPQSQSDAAEQVRWTQPYTSAAAPGAQSQPSGQGAPAAQASGTQPRASAPGSSGRQEWRSGQVAAPSASQGRSTQRFSMHVSVSAQGRSGQPRTHQVEPQASSSQIASAAQSSSTSQVRTGAGPPHPKVNGSVAHRVTTARVGQSAWVVQRVRVLVAGSGSMPGQ